MEPAEIRKLFEKFGTNLDNNDVWKVQQATVLKHKALERLAASAGIKFDAPVIIRAERDEAVILATGRLGDVSEWSIGEALIDMNYRVSGKQAGYVYAMAEKRAKDRVILKLAGLHGLYSEDEADEFKESSSAPQQGRNATTAVPRTSSGTVAPLSQAGELYRQAMLTATNKDDLGAWMNDKAEELKEKLGEAEASTIRQLAAARYRELPEARQEAAE
jgi:hypothetical protein